MNCHRKDRICLETVSKLITGNPNEFIFNNIDEDGLHIYDSDNRLVVFVRLKLEGLVRSSQPSSQNPTYKLFNDPKFSDYKVKAGGQTFNVSTA
jgi:hypothetical protein